MFVPQTATRPPSSRDSPRLQPQRTRSELEVSQAAGHPPPVFTPSLHRSLRKARRQRSMTEPYAIRRRSSSSTSISDHKNNHDGPAPAAADPGSSASPAMPRARQSPGAQIFFRPRTSILDYTELMYQGSDRIRGLVTCFWTIVGAYLVSLLVSHYEKSGEFMSSELAGLIFSRGLDLVLSDVALVVSTAFVVPFVYLMWVEGFGWSGWLDPRTRGSMAVQALAEVAWLVLWYVWQGSRGWPWSQRCFFALHTMVNWMKVHSYMSTNRRLAGLRRTKHGLLAKKSDDAEASGGDFRVDEKLDVDETASKIAAIDAELCPYTVRFPQNMTLANYCMFQLSPTLVYELEYPRTPGIRWGYVAEKLAGTAGIFVVFYIVVAHLMIPHLERMSETGVLIATVHLMGPMATCWLLFFFITFDSIANGFAELTRFADRRFYDDWWNARGLDEFSRKWNRPVHMFLARHIYMPVRENWQPAISSSGNQFLRLRKAIPASVAAMAATFFFSSILHELTIVVACHRWNHGLFFFSQMMQIPLIICSERIRWFKEQQALRNWSFWLAMVVFQPLLLCMYTYKAFDDRYVAAHQPIIPDATSTSLILVSTNATLSV
ncbi:Sterol O-acyltransferase 2 (Sterol-ester synthase 2) [Coemansia sp. RSA 2599]|nr:Sterol O-acyltransferase 2 (Sterol-ester synthase 2) [Coemansia sp. RSA 2598]KAJ1829073.1 Sterol O-acyltransferase 2 (Sterol-ester synthase 2) [Coemansia sp. RSA 2599]